MATKKATEVILTFDRVKSNADTTVSVVYIDKVFECFGLEDEFRKEKIVGETRIPAGKYKVIVKKTGGHHERYSKLFEFHRGMLQLENVPGFTDILIHIGNTDKDTAGCLLVGGTCISRVEPFKVLDSTLAYSELYKKIIDAAEKGILWVEIFDNDKVEK